MGWARWTSIAGFAFAALYVAAFAIDNGRSWSPEGRKIAFGSSRDGNPEIYVVNADGSVQRNLTRTPTRNEGVHLAWSPARK